MLSTDMQALINEFGQEVTLRKVTTGVYNTDTGVVSNTTQDYTVKSYMAMSTRS